MYAKKGRKLKLTTLSLLAVCAFSSCTYQRHRYYDYQNSVDVTPDIVQRKEVTDRKVATITKLLDLNGVNVVTVGQDYRVIIPVEKLFYYKSPRIMWASYDVLNMVVDYLKQFRKVSMRVNAFSRDDDRKRAGALSYARARAIQDYLWSQDVDTRVIYTQAHSMETDPTNCCGKMRPEASDVHSHIEISFRNTII